VAADAGPGSRAREPASMSVTVTKEGSGMPPPPHTVGPKN
jgi:hypothetical protein